MTILYMSHHKILCLLNKPNYAEIIFPRSGDHGYVYFQFTSWHLWWIGYLQTQNKLQIKGNSRFFVGKYIQNTLSWKSNRNIHAWTMHDYIYLIFNFNWWSIKRLIRLTHFNNSNDTFLSWNLMIIFKKVLPPAHKLDH